MDGGDVLVVGGGPAGLSTAGALASRGIRARVVDRGKAIGSSWLDRYERLRLHTIRRFSGLAGFGIPRSYPKYLSRTMYAEYLERYRDHFKIDVRYSCEAERVRALAGANGDARFAVQTKDGEYTARYVVIATGEFTTPLLPRIDGIERFGGEMLHAAHYRTGRDYAYQRVLVVGLGNTGAEIAADLTEHGAAFTAVSVRSAPPVVPRDFLGTPVQLFGIALSSIPPAIADRIGAAIASIAMGDLQRYGLQAAQWSPFSAKRIPVIDVGFARNLRRGNIAVRPTIAHFTETGVVFADGKEERYDTVIFATGYRTGLRELVDIPNLIDGDGYPTCNSGAPTSSAGLYFMGYFHSHRGHLFEIARASERLGSSIASDLAR